MNAFPLLDVQTTVERARDLRARIDVASDPRRVVTDLSMSTIASLAILVGQLDEIAATAAASLSDPHDIDPRISLRKQLIATGHLPLSPSTEPAKEPAHGEG